MVGKQPWLRGMNKEKPMASGCPTIPRALGHSDPRLPAGKGAKFSRRTQNSSVPCPAGRVSPHHQCQGMPAWEFSAVMIKMTEFHIGLRWKGPLGWSSSTPCHEQFSTIPGLLQPGFGSFQGWGSHGFSAREFSWATSPTLQRN